MKGFWDVIDSQLAELEHAASADDVGRILGAGDQQGDLGFFAGGGGDTLPDAPLSRAGWRILVRVADYYWAMRAPNGDVITYIEGDVYRGNRIPPQS